MTSRKSLRKRMKKEIDECDVLILVEILAAYVLLCMILSQF